MGSTRRIAAANSRPQPRISAGMSVSAALALDPTDRAPAQPFRGIAGARGDRAMGIAIPSRAEPARGVPYCWKSAQ
jgi:hypothetical protein